MEDGEPCIEADAWPADDQRAVSKPHVQMRIRHDHGLAACDDMGAEGELARGFVHIQTNA